MVEFVFKDNFLSGHGQKFRAACGRAGVTAHKQEGDGATPLGLLPLERVLFRADRIKALVCAVPTEPIGPDDGWCDDPQDSLYNRMVRLPYAGRHERLHRPDALYDVIGVLGWNSNPIIRDRGSAIFLHVAAADYAPTAGCIALALHDLSACLAAGLTAIRVVA